MESYVAGELRKQLSWTEPQSSLFHFRTSAGLEVDLLVERQDGTVAGIEVKSKAAVSPADFTGLERLRALLGKRFRAGVVIYTGERILPFGDGLCAVPLEVLWAG